MSNDNVLTDETQQQADLWDAYIVASTAHAVLLNSAAKRYSHAEAVASAERLKDAWRAFMDSFSGRAAALDALLRTRQKADGPIRGSTAIEADSRIDASKATLFHEYCIVSEAASEAWHLLRVIESAELLSVLPTDPNVALDHNSACYLISVAADGLRAALKEVDAHA